MTLNTQHTQSICFTKKPFGEYAQVGERFQCSARDDVIDLHCLSIEPAETLLALVFVLESPVLTLVFPLLPLQCPSDNRRPSPRHVSQTGPDESPERSFSPLIPGPGSRDPVCLWFPSHCISKNPRWWPQRHSAACHHSRPPSGFTLRVQHCMSHFEVWNS